MNGWKLTNLIIEYSTNTEYYCLPHIRGQYN